jgi:hypothetical protein
VKTAPVVRNPLAAATLTKIGLDTRFANSTFNVSL